MSGFFSSFFSLSHLSLVVIKPGLVGEVFCLRRQKKNIEKKNEEKSKERKDRHTAFLST